MIKIAREGPCIVCASMTPDRSEGSGRRHWRCADFVECAVRRNARKRRPKPEAEVRAWAVGQLRKRG